MQIMCREDACEWRNLCGLLVGALAATFIVMSVKLVDARHQIARMQGVVYAVDSAKGESANGH